ncbi:hypothetical protein B0J11DRAFT_504161 [Dendryphion nanum]|uniref:Uncharacterized protein n=1 Tax=Dendryphion nanum TaxID=256645 RepID=A0A9P9E447_9PLEO|nr:hypothetical protein B0J11DRAFT_504161 [Dendryphion nanum]
MGSCLPFILLSSSIPLTLHSDLPDPAFNELKADQRRLSSLPNHSPESIDTQPSPTTSPIPFRRFSKYEQRRASTGPPLGLRHQTSSTFKKGRTSSTDGMKAPMVHEQWVGVRSEEKYRKRGMSDPVRPLRHESIRMDSRASSNLFSPPPRYSSSTNSKFAVRDSLDSSHLSTASTLAPSLPSPRPIHLTPIPLQTLTEHEPVSRPLTPPTLPTIPSPSLHLSLPHYPPPNHIQPHASPLSTPPYPPPQIPLPTPPSTPTQTQTQTLNPSPSRRPSKKVSFSPTTPEIIPKSPIVEPHAPPRRQSSWSGLFLISSPPLVPKTEIARRRSLPSMRGQVAGRSILRASRGVEEEGKGKGSGEGGLDEVVGAIEMERGVRTRGGRRRGNHVRMNSASTLVGSEAEGYVLKGLEHAPLVLRDLPSLDISFEMDDEDGEPVEVGGVGQEETSRCDLGYHTAQSVVLTRTKKPLPTDTRHRGGKRPQTIRQHPGLDIAADQRAVRHWSMQSGGWVRRSGMYIEGAVDKENKAVPPVPLLPAEF